MSIRFHPKPEILIKYASGHLSSAYAMAIELHTKFCNGCADHVIELNNIGGKLLNAQKNTSVKLSFDDLMTKIDSLEQEATESIEPGHISADVTSIMQLAKTSGRKRNWKAITSKISNLSVDLGDKDYDVNLIKMKGGSKVPAHTHKGTEVTVVINGSFKDAYGEYNVGDFLIRDSSTKHSPHADVDCICFAVTDAPLHYTGMLGPFINWFAGRQSNAFQH